MRFCLKINMEGFLCSLSLKTDCLAENKSVQCETFGI